MNRFVASIIAGDGLDQGDWSRLTSSLKPHVDAIALSWNGEKQKPPTWMFECGVPIANVWKRWDDDFAAQRNASFDVAKHLFAMDDTWIIWIDTDDELVVQGTLDDLVDGLDDASSGVFLRYDYSRDPGTGTVIVEQWRERMMRADIPWRWKHPIHEVCVGPVGTQYARREEVWVVHHRPSGHEPSTRERNRRILSKALETEPNEPRHRFYMANEIYAEADQELDKEKRENLLRAAVAAFKSYLSMESWSDSAYHANHRMADIHRELGEQDVAIDIDLQGIKLKPSWPDSYNGIALSCLDIGDFDRVMEWASLSLKASAKPDTAQIIEPLELRYTPYLLRGVAKKHKGMLTEAKSDLRVAAAAWSPPELLKRMQELDELIAQRGDVQEIDKEALKDERRRLRGSRPEKSIAFFTRPHFEDWHHKLESEVGFGGSETAVMRVAERYANDGWRTVVFGTPGEHEGYDGDTGIEWWKTEDFVHSEPFTVFVSSRSPEVFEAPIKAKARVLWMHDVNVKDQLLDKRLVKNIDLVTAQTPWHEQHLRRLYDLRANSLVLMPNGIDTSLFAQEPEQRDAPSFVYSSSPDRGLDVLLGLWEEVRGKWPEATLDIFYGWEGIDRLIASNPKSFMSQRFLYFKQYIGELIEALGGEEGGIRWRGRTPQAQLAKELYNATAWLYPTFFCETFCITALEMQAAGVLPVTSDRAGLKTTVACSEQLVPGWPNNLTYQREWLKKLEQTMGMASTGQARFQQLKGRQHAMAHDWDDSYEHWRKLTDGLV